MIRINSVAASGRPVSTITAGFLGQINFLWQPSQLGAAVVCRSHGPFTWGRDVAQAVYYSVVLEEVAKMAILKETVDPKASPAPQSIQDKHFLRKHGPNAYYGQSTK